MPEIKEHSFRCGYAPRSIRYSLNSETLFVGCKDGTVTIVTGLAGKDDSKIHGYRTAELSSPGKRRLTARSLIEWQAWWLLIGRDDGSIDLMDWRIAKEETCHEPELIPVLKAPKEPDPDRVTCLEWLDQRRLLVSFRTGEARVVIQDPDAKGPDSVLRAFEAAWANPSRVLPGVKKLLGIVRMMKPGTEDPIWLLLAQSGRIWQAEEQRGELIAHELTGIWPAGETPGFISDYVQVKPRYVEREREGGGSRSGPSEPTELTSRRTTESTSCAGRRGKRRSNGWYRCVCLCPASGASGSP